MSKWYVVNIRFKTTNSTILKRLKAFDDENNIPSTDFPEAKKLKECQRNANALAHYNTLDVTWYGEKEATVKFFLHELLTGEEWDRTIKWIDAFANYLGTTIVSEMDCGDKEGWRVSKGGTGEYYIPIATTPTEVLDSYEEEGKIAYE